MYPLLFQVGNVAIWSHSVFVALGIVTALGLSWFVARHRRRATAQFIWILAGGLVGAAFLARYGLVLRYLLDATQPSLTGFLHYGGRSLLAGLGGAYAGVLIVKRLIRYRAHTGDLLAPGVAFGIAIGRIGCHLAETPGTATAMPWGVHVPAGLAHQLVNCVACRTGAAMHPSFLYESAFLLLAGIWLYPRALRAQYPASWMHDGDLFKLFLLVYGTFRFFVEFTRENPPMALGLSGSQLTVLVSSVVLFWRFTQRYRATLELRVASSPSVESELP